jgi:hypothetical protein
MTIFLADKILHSSSVNELEPNNEFPSIGLGCVQKSRVYSVSEHRASIVESFVNFDILNVYYGLNPVPIGEKE